jgi:formate hydrogenlyase subunit 6/NADH:ubiquinone oxidoreductase subunit I
MTGSKEKYPGLPPVPPSWSGTYPPVAEVVERACIGCDRCPPLCFFDALLMVDRPAHPHKRVAVVVPTHCTGCGLCFEACPVDAIIWVPDKSPAAIAGRVIGGGKKEADNHSY